MVDEASVQEASARADANTARSQVQVAKAAEVMARARIEAAKADVEEAMSDLRIAQVGLHSEETIEGYARIMAPFDGIVTRRDYHVRRLHPLGQGGKCPSPSSRSSARISCGSWSRCRMTMYPTSTRAILRRFGSMPWEPAGIFRAGSLARPIPRIPRIAPSGPRSICPIPMDAFVPDNSGGSRSTWRPGRMSSESREPRSSGRGRYGGLLPRRGRTRDQDPDQDR